MTEGVFWYIKSNERTKKQALAASLRDEIIAGEKYCFSTSSDMERLLAPEMK
jgi:hypothetical protein